MNDNQIKKSFIALRCMKPDGFVNNMASGCLVSYQSKLFLLTVFHGIGYQADDEKWLMEIKWDQRNMGMESIDLSGGINYLRDFSINGSITPEQLKSLFDTQENTKEIDFAWVQFPRNDIEPYYQEITNISGYPSNVMKKTIHPISFNIKPDYNQRYCFGGYTRKVNIDTFSNVKKFENCLSIERNWMFLREEYIQNKGQMYIFKPLDGFKGDDFYYGCSGAPIMDNDGNVVALVVGRNPDNTDEMWGINLNAYKIAIDASIGNIYGMENFSEI